MNIGAHVPMHNSKKSARNIGADVVQIHLGSPRKWGQTAPPKGEVADRLYVHAPYLINLSTADASVLTKSIWELYSQMELAKELGAEGLVVHGGSYKKSDLHSAIEQWRRALDAAPNDLPIFVENAASGKSSPTRDLDELAVFWCALGDRLSMCLDTAHLWASLPDPENAWMWVSALKATVGSIPLVHCNGSAAASGSGRDVHSPLATSLAPVDWVVECTSLAQPVDVIAESSDPEADVLALRNLLMETVIVQQSHSAG